MKPLSIDLRKRIIETCDEKRLSQNKIAKQFRVSLGMVKKLIAQRKNRGTIRPLYEGRNCRRKISPEHIERFKSLIKETPGITLEEIRKKSSLDCTVQAIFYALKSVNYTYKKNSSRK